MKLRSDQIERIENLVAAGDTTTILTCIERWIDLAIDDERDDAAERARQEKMWESGESMGS